MKSKYRLRANNGTASSVKSIFFIRLKSYIMYSENTTVPIIEATNSAADEKGTKILINPITTRASRAVNRNPLKNDKSFLFSYQRNSLLQI